MMIINGEEVEIVIEKKRIKNIYFRVKDDLKIHVTCPRLVSKSEIMRLVNFNAKSIEKMYYEKKGKQTREKRVLLLGRELAFVLNKRIKFAEGIAYGPSIDAVNEYLEKKSLKVFQDRLDKYRDEFPNLPEFRLRTRKMKTRWGVCNKGSMTVTINTLLIHKEVHLIDYVIVHELSHFEHMDHSSAFWAEVARHYPNYKKARRELRD